MIPNSQIKKDMDTEKMKRLWFTTVVPNKADRSSGLKDLNLNIYVSFKIRDVKVRHIKEPRKTLENGNLGNP